MFNDTFSVMVFNMFDSECTANVNIILFFVVPFSLIQKIMGHVNLHVSNLVFCNMAIMSAKLKKQENPKYVMVRTEA